MTLAACSLGQLPFQLVDGSNPGPSAEAPCAGWAATVQAGGAQFSYLGHGVCVGLASLGAVSAQTVQVCDPTDNGYAFALPGAGVPELLNLDTGGGALIAGAVVAVLAAGWGIRTVIKALRDTDPEPREFED